MIISITCRNGTEDKICRADLSRQLVELSKFTKKINRIQVMFSKKNRHKNADDLVMCHLSIHVSNGRPIEIYEYQPTEPQAFYRARERATMQLRRNSHAKSFTRKSYKIAEDLEYAS